MMAVQGVIHRVPAYLVTLLCLAEVLPAVSVSDRSYYETLNVELSASSSHVKKAFRQLAIKYHPDKNKRVDAEKTFREVVEAYRVLSNKETRRLYDNVGHVAFLKDEDPVDPEDEHETRPFGFEDLFHDFEDSPFVEEPLFHWTFHQDGSEEDGPYQHYSIEEPGFSFYFGDEEEDQYC